jgi:hypothetical protein
MEAVNINSWTYVGNDDKHKPKRKVIWIIEDGRCFY